MKLLPEKRMSSSYLRIDDEKIITDYIDITQYDVFKEMTTSFTLEDYKDVDIDISGKEGKIILTVPKEKIISFLEKSKKMIQREEYIEKYLTFKDRIGIKALRYIISREMIDPDLLMQYLPAKDLIEKDYELWDRLSVLSCGYYATEEGLLSIELAKRLAMGERLDDCPEQMIYHYYKYPDKYQSTCDVPFTKSELIESIEIERAVQQIKRKK